MPVPDQSVALKCSHRWLFPLEMDLTLTEKLREDACILRKLHKEGKDLDELRTRKTRMLGEIYRLLCICLILRPLVNIFYHHHAASKHRADHTENHNRRQQLRQRHTVL